MANVQVLIEKMGSADKDYRYMACNDLIKELQKPEFKLTERLERKVRLFLPAHKIRKYWRISFCSWWSNSWSSLKIPTAKFKVWQSNGTWNRGCFVLLIYVSSLAPLVGKIIPDLVDDIVSKLVENMSKPEDQLRDICIIGIARFLLWFTSRAQVCLRRVVGRFVHCISSVQTYCQPAHRENQAGAFDSNEEC